MALLQYFKRKAKQNDKTQRYSFITKEETEKADEAVLKTLEVYWSSLAQGKSRGKYNCYTGKQRAQIGKYAAENGPTRAAKHLAATRLRFTWPTKTHAFAKLIFRQYDKMLDSPKLITAK